MAALNVVPAPETHKRLAVFLDGTSNKAEVNTNVWRARSLCSVKGADGLAQLVYYGPGVGTETGEILRGDVFGYGIDAQVIDAYQWLIENYDDGDETFVFGFSRGAFAARSLSGFISRCGLIQPGAPLGVKELYDRYKRGNAALTIHQLLETGTDKTSFDLQEKWMIKDCRPVPVKFTGVWDTVGSVAHNDMLSFITGGDHSFLDTNLRKSEQFVYHAMAIDENRAPFDVTLLSYYKPNDAAGDYTSPRALADVEQRWFSGSHADVGGGCNSDAASQLPLKWLLSKASAHGLAFKRDIEIDPEATTEPIFDAYSQAYHAAFAIASLGIRHWRIIGRDPQKLAETTVHMINETIDGSVFARCKRDDGYRPQNLMDWAARHGIEVTSVGTSVMTDDGKPATD
jgi:uncharacterized protein (DUF2235 family)